MEFDVIPDKKNQKINMGRRPNGSLTDHLFRGRWLAGECTSTTEFWYQISILFSFSSSYKEIPAEGQFKQK
jgi:hypothetical protein